MLAIIPENVIARGTTECRAYAGPTWRFSKEEGSAKITRSETEIVVSSRFGDLKISQLVEDGEVHVTLPKGRTYRGKLYLSEGSVVFETADHKRVTLEPNGDRVDISLKGFGPVADRMGVYLKRVKK